jgi:spore coat polysaccharide biosynthesis protein SpsF
MERTAVVLQARMGSTRLPGKSLALIGAQTILARAIARLRVSGLPVIVATTTLPEDDRLAAAAVECGAEVVRGSAADVLDRFALAIREHTLDVVVRATADNPAVDLDAAQRTTGLLLRTGADYLCEHGLPYGAGVEAVRAAAILRAAEWADDPYDREHVTPLIRKDRRFVGLTAIAPPQVQAASLRMTVDTEDDLAAARRLFAAAETDEAPRPVSLTRLIAVATDLMMRDAPVPAKRGA